MLVYPRIDPVAIQVGSLAVHWYGVMYLLAFLGCYWMVRYRVRVRPLDRPLAPEQVGDWLFYIVLGVLLGGRLGYCLFYSPGLLADFSPVSLFGLNIPMWGALKVWEGGMSFHGGLLGVLVATWLLGRKVGSGFFRMTDFLAPAVPFGLLCGRIGNFINGELWGRPADVPWAIVFPHVDALPRHPSMLYEAALEGVVLWAVLWWYSARPRPRAAVSGLFLAGYGLFRFLVEFVREPDEHLGYLAFDWVTMGHLLSFPMLAVGAGMMIAAYRRQGRGG